MVKIKILLWISDPLVSDQLTALKFTKREVAKFGGDPNKITLLGHSSGGDNAYSLYLSPLTADLISQVVIMSGANVEQEL
uniref:Carboxylic ester hydrolase n=1 Tax=Steinernema glaseri TaxID=37863 RepID=A0A1I8AGT9_9BILA